MASWHRLFHWAHFCLGFCEQLSSLCQVLDGFFFLFHVHLVYFFWHIYNKICHSVLLFQKNVSIGNIFVSWDFYNKWGSWTSLRQLKRTLSSWGLLRWYGQEKIPTNVLFYLIRSSSPSTILQQKPPLLIFLPCHTVEFSRGHFSCVLSFLLILTETTV